MSAPRFSHRLRRFIRLNIYNHLKATNQKREYSDSIYPNQELTYKIIGMAMEVHRYLGNGFAEIVYKDALVEEFNRAGIYYERERKFEIEYKGIILPHYYFADFVVDSDVILEVKAQEGIHDQAVPQVINYLAVSKLRSGLILNFGEQSLKFRRVVFNRKTSEESEQSVADRKPRIS